MVVTEVHVWVRVLLLPSSRPPRFSCSVDLVRTIHASAQSRLGAAAVVVARSSRPTMRTRHTTAPSSLVTVMGTSMSCRPDAVGSSYAQVASMRPGHGTPPGWPVPRRVYVCMCQCRGGGGGGGGASCVCDGPRALVR
jgi:hypothetical protein